jgi:hypothetical protein
MASGFGGNCCSCSSRKVKREGPGPGGCRHLEVFGCGSSIIFSKNILATIVGHWMARIMKDLQKQFSSDFKIIKRNC